MRTEDMPKSPEQGSTFSQRPEVGCRRPSRRVEGTPQSIQDRMPSTVPESGIGDSHDGSV